MPTIITAPTDRFLARSVRLPSLLLGISTFLSAFLLFQVQPIAAKVLLPIFGGSAAVWSICLVFFQTALFLGYLYAHLINVRVPLRRQLAIHAVVVSAAAAMAVFVPRYPWGDGLVENEALSILYRLSIGIGFPYFLLATTGPLLQAWYARTDPRGVPYRLYAVSNLASLIGLLCYPFLLEPLLALRTQLTSWRAAFWLLAVLLFASLFALRLEQGDDESPSAPSNGDRAAPTESPSIKRRLAWLALPACSSALLLAVTAHITENIAPIPLFWIVPLAIYLGSFAICFERADWYDSGLVRLLLVAALCFMSLFAVVPVGISSIALSLSFVLGGQAIICMFCHGELYALRPPSRGLTEFYLYVSLGGAAGGLFVGLAAPQIFSGYAELPLLVFFCAGLAFAITTREGCGTSRLWRLLMIGLGGVALYNVAVVGSNVLISARGFYGVLTVSDQKNDSAGPVRVLRHGKVIHGAQFLSEENHNQPTAYYGPTSGAGLILNSRHDRPWRVGVLGLGAGVLAIYSKPGDVYRFYEINPFAARFAREYFTFLDRAEGDMQISVDDARLALEREPPQGFDVLVVDVFSGDSIPLHLLTKQAFEQYRRHLKDDGVLAVHISNLYLDLAPVVRRLATEIQTACVIVQDEAPPNRHLSDSIWALLLSDPRKVEMLLQSPSAQVAEPVETSLWTDDYVNLLSALR